ncbi:MAG: oxidoreductase, partial [Desulfatiglandales bacterium]
AEMGYCLYKMGCKGPDTYNNCPVVKFNEGTGWPIGAGHPCIGCSEPNFWDKMAPFFVASK